MHSTDPQWTLLLNSAPLKLNPKPTHSTRHRRRRLTDEVPKHSSPSLSNCAIDSKVLLLCLRKIIDRTLNRYCFFFFFRISIFEGNTQFRCALCYQPGCDWHEFTRATIIWYDSSDFMESETNLNWTERIRKYLLSQKRWMVYARNATLPSWEKWWIYINPM